MSSLVKKNINYGIHIFDITIGTFIGKVHNLRISDQFVNMFLLRTEGLFVKRGVALFPFPFKPTSNTPFSMDGVVVPWEFGFDGTFPGHKGTNFVKDGRSY